MAESSRPAKGNDMGTVELAIRFCAWSHELRRFPTPQQICTRFQVSRATAYRWRRFLADAYGIDPPPFAEDEA
ncbi:hypothetical protein ACI2IY_05770 [Lysobacter enzymogenes]|uniref:hypothetical protein n=1 Tax=Lysobacter enzymogenes TaxID=69 RepID=UPI003850CE2C